MGTLNASDSKRGTPASVREQQSRGQCLHFLEFGFWDGRGSVGKAKKSWTALQLLGFKGAIPADGTCRQDAQSRAKELRCILRRHFEAEGDPLKVEYDNMVERLFDADGELCRTKHHGGRKYVAKFAVDVSALTD